MSRNGMRRHKNDGFEEDEVLKRPAATRRLPFETADEYKRFWFFMNATPHSVREAYRLYCKATGKAAHDYPPSNWYPLSRGEYAAFRKTEQRLHAIERACEKCGRVVDWPAFEAIVNQAIAEGELDQEIYRGEFGEVMTGMKVVEVAFMSLAVDLNGDPLPGQVPWEERVKADRRARGRVR